MALGLTVGSLYAHREIPKVGSIDLGIEELRTVPVGNFKSFNADQWRKDIQTAQTILKAQAENPKWIKISYQTFKEIAAAIDGEVILGMSYMNQNYEVSIFGGKVLKTYLKNSKDPQSGYWADLETSTGVIKIDLYADIYVLDRVL